MSHHRQGSQRYEALLGEMLEAARNERVSEQSLESSRLAALGVLEALPTVLPAATLSASSSVASTAEGAGAALAKSAIEATGTAAKASITVTLLPALGLGFLASSAVLLGATALPLSSNVTSAAKTPAVAMSAPLAGRHSALRELDAEHPSQSRAVSTGSPEPRRAVPAQAVPTASTTASAKPASPLDELKIEVELVQAAQRELGAGRPEASLQLLDLHRRQVERPRLMQEVLYLRLRALWALNQTGQARAVADDLLAQFPDGPHVAAARRVREGIAP